MARVGLVGCLVAGLVATSGPAFADELQDYLEKAADADYAGRRIVMTMWDGSSHATIAAVEHTGDVMMLGGTESETVIGHGRVTVSGSSGVALSGWTAPQTGEKYRAGDIEDLRRLGREARSVTVFEGDLVRARIVFDVETWAPLATEIFDGSGELFRFAAFTEFDANPRRVYEAMDDDGYDYDVVAMVDASSLPDSAGGYERVDAYRGPDDVVQTFFSDGLFSFSVFEVAPRRSRARFAEAETVAMADATYLVLVDPTEIWVTWEHGETGYVLVGDLPPDHLESVLGDLPAPNRKGFLARLLSIFGS